MAKIGQGHRYVIIGAGPCGLGAGWRLTELGVEDFHIYEAADHPGGLASSYRDDNGFAWDVGGHVLHSHYPYFDHMFESVMQGEYLTHERESWVWIYDRFIPYPFQNNIHRLPPAIRDECLRGLEHRATAGSVQTFKDWILASFGQGIAKHFLFPYNEKVWAYPPERMNKAWVGDRVAVVDLDRIKENIRMNRDDVSWGPNAVFKFPKNGGTGDIWRRVASRYHDHISYGKTVTRIDAAKRTVYFADGSTDNYDRLLTTMPLDALGRILDGVTLPASDPLFFSRVTIVGIGIRGEVPEHMQSKCWMYFPGDTAPFFRATVFSNYAPSNAPEGAWSLMTETSSSDYRRLPSGDIARAVIDGAVRTKLIPSRRAVVDVWVFDADRGYPTPTIGRDAYLSAVLPLLERHRIYSRGRFGAWKYEVSNQDHTFMQGVEWVNRMRDKGEELTVTRPSEVNAPR